MMKTGIILWFLALMPALPCPRAHAATLDCAGGLISVGDSRVDLLSKCGDPDAKEAHEEEITERPGDGSKRRLFVAVEDWTYNFGPGRFMRIVTLKNGTVTNIRTRNYGYSRNAKPDQRECSEQVVSVGDTKSDVIAKCGEPAWKDTRQEELKEKLDDGREHKILVTIEDWTYNLGPNRFVRILTFRNGRLTDIRTGKYGY
jgi:hypothetical protein